MKLLSVFAFLSVLVSLSVASLAAAERLTRDTSASSIDGRDEGVTADSSVAANTDEAAPSGYWSAWAEAAAH